MTEKVLRFDRPLARGLWQRLRRRFYITASRRRARCARRRNGEKHLCLISPCTILLNWTLTSVSRLKGRPLIGQARGQLRLTWRSYAGPPQPPLSGCAGLPQREVCHLVLRSLSLPYSTAITDSLDSQVTHVPLRIQFTGVTQVPLPPLFRGQNRPLYAFLSCHMWHITRRPSSLTIYNSPFTISSSPF